MNPGRNFARSSDSFHHRRLAAFAGSAMMLLLAGCSTFERDWRAASQAPEQRDALVGRWQGTWRSEVNGHNDQLRAVVTPASNDVYSARFHAKYKLGFLRFSFGHSVLLQARRANDAFQFEGGADLGWLAGGVYRYEGSATATNFTSTYRSKYDHGTFKMTRPSAKD